MPHLHTDNTPLYASSKPDNISNYSTMAYVTAWLTWLNATHHADCNSIQIKSRLLLDRSRASISKLALQDCCLVVDVEMISLSDVIRDLGILLDSELSMKQHIAKITTVCFCHLHQLHEVRHRVGREVTI